MKKIMIAAMESGAGKTLLSCGLMNLLKKQNKEVAAFKCGPDYIDPMFHSKVLGIKSRNLDVFLMEEKGVLRTFKKAKGDIAVIESAMGFYDGISGRPEGSGWHTAKLLGAPVVLVVKPKASGITLAAQIQGLCEFRSIPSEKNNDPADMLQRHSNIIGVILNSCSGMQYEYYKTMIEEECGIPVFGFLPKMKEADFPSRHLGLYTASEIEDFRSRIDAVSEALEANCDIDLLFNKITEIENYIPANLEETLDFGDTLYDNSLSSNSTFAKIQDDKVEGGSTAKTVIAVAHDEAFCFYYEDNFEALEAAGAEVVFFSPLHDESLPEASGLYIGGGYPELYLKELSENNSMKESIKRAIENGMPVIAECGGFLYLGESISYEGKDYPMTGVLPFSGYNNKGLTRFGYATLKAKTDSMLLKKEEEISVHEFHYYDTTDPGSSLMAKKPNGRTWDCAFTSDTMYAGFPHLYFKGSINLAERFVEAASRA